MCHIWWLLGCHLPISTFQRAKHEIPQTRPRHLRSTKAGCQIFVWVGHCWGRSLGMCDTYHLIYIIVDGYCKPLQYKQYCWYKPTYVILVVDLAFSCRTCINIRTWFFILSYASAGVKLPRESFQRASWDETGEKDAKVNWKSCSLQATDPEDMLGIHTMWSRVMVSSQHTQYNQGLGFGLETEPSACTSLYPSRNQDLGNGKNCALALWRLFQDVSSA